MALADQFAGEAAKNSTPGDTPKPGLDYNIETGTGTFTTNPTTGETDPAQVLNSYGFNADDYNITPVSLKRWNATVAGGAGDLLTSITYRIERKTETAIDELDLEQLRQHIWNRKPPKATRTKTTPVAAVLNLADLQLYKDDPAATIGRVHNATHAFKTMIDRHRAAGTNINEVVVVNNGDPFEGIAGNYANQLHTVRGGLRDQMNAVLDLWTHVTSEVFTLAPKQQFVSVLCNHTQFGRQGGAKDSITGDSDNGSAFLAETLQRVTRHTFPKAQYTIPRDEMNVYATIADVKVGFNHGHKIPGIGPQAFEKWLGGQVRYDRNAYEADVWITAHRHHFASWDMGSAFVFQCPSCDNGSKWLTDTTGTHSRSGILAMLIGKHTPLSTSDATFL